MKDHVKGAAGGSLKPVPGDGSLGRLLMLSSENAGFDAVLLAVPWLLLAGCCC